MLTNVRKAWNSETKAHSEEIPKGTSAHVRKDPSWGLIEQLYSNFPVHYWFMPVENPMLSKCILLWEDMTAEVRDN